MKKISEKNLITIIIVLVILLSGAVGWIAFSSRKPAMNYAYASVVKGTLTHEIKTTGMVKASQELDLSFDRSGKVKNVAAKAGDKVKAGQVLAELDNADLNADLSQTVAGVQMAESQLHQLEAALQLQQIKKTEMLKGARPEEVQLAATKRDNMARSLSDAQANLNNVTDKAQSDYSSLIDNISDLAQDASAKATDAVNRQTDDMFYNGSSANPDLIFAVPSNPSLEAQAQDQRIKANQAVQTLKTLPQAIQPDYSNYDQVAAQAIDQLQMVRSFLNTMVSALNSAVASVDFPQDRISMYKSNISGSLANINGAITGLNGYRQAVTAQKAANLNTIKAAETKVDDAKSALATAEDELALKKAGATREQLAAQDALVGQAEATLDAQRAQINSARANVQRASTQFDKTIIKSPIDGTVAKFDLKVGESVTLGVSEVSVMSAAKFQIEGFVSEADVDSVKVGNQADVTLDSDNGATSYSAKVIMVDPAATPVNGNPTYKVTLEFSKEDALIKSGLTANVKILAGQEKDALIIPETSVIKDGEDRYVIVNNGTSGGEKRKIEVGSLNENGKVSVRSGLSENDQVADFASKIIK